MKYKEGDRVQIKSIDWYNKNKDSNGNVIVFSKVSRFSWCENVRTIFTKDMTKFCDKVVTIENVWTVNYSIVEGTYRHYITDEMIEGLVEEEFEVDLIPKFGEYSDNEPLDIPTMTTEFVKEHGLPCPEGYIFKDENGNVINATKIVLEKKKKEYPKSFGECCKILGTYSHHQSIVGYKNELFSTFQKLIICRDAYWKIAGEEIGLGKPWKPDSKEPAYAICRIVGTIKTMATVGENYILELPTEEMCDAFKENFDPDIEFCKELL